MDRHQEHLKNTASRTDYVDENMHSGFRRIAKHIPNGSRVLDIACGSGSLLSALSEKGCTVAGVDLAPGAVEMCKKKGLDVLQGNADEFDRDPALISLFGREWDYLVFSKCLVYLTRKNDIFKSFQGRGIYIYQSNQSYWRRVLVPDLNIRSIDGAEYILNDGRVIDINSLESLRYWGESFGYKSYVLNRPIINRKNVSIYFGRK